MKREVENGERREDQVEMMEKTARVGGEEGGLWSSWWMRILISARREKGEVHSIYGHSLFILTPERM